MIITIGFVCLIGWVVGAWVPWWVIAAMWCGYLIDLCRSKESSLEMIIASVPWGIFLIITSLSGFIFGDVAFIDIWEFIVMLFTGGK